MRQVKREIRLSAADPVEDKIPPDGDVVCEHCHGDKFAVFSGGVLYIKYRDRRMTISRIGDSVISFECRRCRQRTVLSPREIQEVGELPEIVVEKPRRRKKGVDT